MSCFIEVTNAEKVLEYPSVSKSMPVNVAGLTKKGYYETENSTSIAVEIVSQKEVYEALFPTCTWTEETVDTSKSFEGFTNPRILTQLRDLARRPDHYPAVHSRPEAPYEFLMSLLLLYPWDRDDLITVAERDNLYRCTLDLVKMLKAWDEPTRNQQKKFKKYSTRLGEPLMLNLVNIAFHHTGFSPRQRSAIVLAGRPTQIAGYHDLWAECRFNAVTWIRRCDRDLINYYAELLGESDESGIMRRFSLWKDSFLHERRDRLSLRTVAEVELLMIDGLLIQAVELQRTR
ncbi:hypothetical protein K491DRAFT_698831 [Lophiostoma macrostomum CBS 122681]|uniref:Uncharacterized protein n=1 Tax=Lophiostoma macrostomum CBS 122681 TaxID=1314788 RepID=A0A6A6SM38_9PLEO|nr:hypothetical protein K491DRAFT_698831 [Lophiostoma macrostomum CBS 122681]